MPRLPSRRWWLRLALGVVWTPIAAELFLRILAPVPMLPRYIEAGPHGIRSNMPSMTYRHQTPEYVVELRTNSQGMRADRDFELEKPAGTRRIVVLGDSFGMGYGVNLEESSLHLLGEGLAEALGCPVEVLNFSVSGFGPAEELVVLEEEALSFEPDLVIQYYFSNDPVDDLRAGLFRLEDGQLVRGNAEYLPAVEIREFLFSFPIYRWLAGESHLYNLARDRAGATVKQLLAAARKIQSPPKAPERPSPAPKETETGGLTAAERLTVRILERMQERSNEAGAEFLILSVPRRLARDTFEEAFPHDDEQALPVVSPIPAFESADGAMLYWERSHGHWTPRGCRLVAETLVERILHDGLLDSCDESS